MDLTSDMNLPRVAPDLDDQVARRAEAAYYCNVPAGGRRRWYLVADFNKHSQEKRLWVFDLQDPKNPSLFLSTRVAHGVGSDPEGLGIPLKFSNRPGSNMTSLGMYAVSESYHGRSGKAYKLDGLTPGWNSAARRRVVVLHRAKYVPETGRVGRSQGCPAISNNAFEIMDRAGVLSNAQLWIDGPSPSLEDAPKQDCSP